MVPLKRPNGSFRNYFAKNQWFLADLLYNAPNGSLRTSFEKTQGSFRNSFIMYAKTQGSFRNSFIMHAKTQGSFRNSFAKNQWFLADLLYNAPNGSLRTSFIMHPMVPCGPPLKRPNLFFFIKLIILIIF